MLTDAARYFKYVRSESGLSITRLAKKSHISRVYLSQIENLTRIPSIEIIEFIFENLGLSFSNYVDVYNKIDSTLEESYKSLVFVNEEMRSRSFSWLSDNKNIIENSQFNIMYSLVNIINKIRTKKNIEALDIVNSIKPFYETFSIMEKQLFHEYGGVLYKNRFEYNQSLKELHFALTFGEGQYTYSMIHYHLGMVYDLIGDNHLAIIYNQKAVELFSKDLNYYRLNNVQVHLANLYSKAGDFESAERIYISTLEQVSNNTKKRAVILRNFAQMKG